MAERNERVSLKGALGLKLAACHPKSFVSFDDADHLLRRKADAIHVGAVLAAWASRDPNYPSHEGLAASAV